MLAREVQVHAPGTPYDPAAVFGVLREEFPACFVFCVGRGDATLIAASPELLVRREGQRVSTIALAGSTAAQRRPGRRRATSASSCCATPSYREEHAIVARRIERTAAPARRLGHRRAGARARADRQHPASRHADPRAARRAHGGARAGRADAPDAGRRRRAAVARRAADPAHSRASTAAGTPGPSAGPTRPATASSASRCAARCCDGNVARCYAGNGIVRELRPRQRARRDRDQAAGAAAAARRLTLLG